MLKDFSVLIPAAGFGTRLKSNKPKALTKFADGELLCHKQIDCINETLDCPEINFVCGFQQDRIYKKIKTQANLIQNEKYETTNVAHSIGLGLNQINRDNVLLIYGDLFFEADTLEDIATSGSCSWILVNRILDNDEVGCIDSNNQAHHLNYGFDYKWSQIAFFQKKEKELFIKHTNKKENSNKLGFEIINKIIDDGGIFRILESKGYITDIDSGSDINQINRYLLG